MMGGDPATEVFAARLAGGVGLRSDSCERRQAPPSDNIERSTHVRDPYHPCRQTRVPDG